MSVVYKQEVIAGLPDFQTIYDLIHPINEVVIGFNAPAVPNGVTATWDDISSEYEGKALWVSSTDAAGTELSGSCPNVTVSLPTGAGGSASESYALLGRTKDTSNKALYITQNGTATKYYSRDSSVGSSDTNWGNTINLDLGNGNSVYSGTDSTVRPTSVVVKVYKRTS